MILFTSISHVQHTIHYYYYELDLFFEFLGHLGNSFCNYNTNTNLLYSILHLWWILKYSHKRKTYYVFMHILIIYALLFVIHVIISRRWCQRFEQVMFKLIHYTGTAKYLNYCIGLLFIYLKFLQLNLNNIQITSSSLITNTVLTHMHWYLIVGGNSVHTLNVSDTLHFFRLEFLYNI